MGKIKLALLVVCTLVAIGVSFYFGGQETTVQTSVPQEPALQELPPQEPDWYSP